MKLTPTQVLEIRARFKSGHEFIGDNRNDRDTGRQLAREYGVAPSTISRIVRGRRWPWLVKPTRKRKADAS